MFTKIGPDTAQSDSGFVLEVTAPYGPGGALSIEYRESEKLLRGSLEPVWSMSAGINSRWEPPFENEPITAEKRRQIQSNILEALDFLGYHYFTFND